MWFLFTIIYLLSTWQRISPRKFHKTFVATFNEVVDFELTSAIYSDIREFQKKSNDVVKRNILSIFSVFHFCTEKKIIVSHSWSYWPRPDDVCHKFPPVFVAILAPLVKLRNIERNIQWDLIKLESSKSHSSLTRNSTIHQLWTICHLHLKGEAWCRLSFSAWVSVISYF